MLKFLFYLFILFVFYKIIISLYVLVHSKIQSLTTNPIKNTPMLFLLKHSFNILFFLFSLCIYLSFLINTCWAADANNSVAILTASTEGNFNPEVKAFLNAPGPEGYFVVWYVGA